MVMPLAWRLMLFLKLNVPSPNAMVVPGWAVAKAAATFDSDVPSSSGTQAAVTPVQAGAFDLPPQEAVAAARLIRRARVRIEDLQRASDRALDQRRPASAIGQEAAGGGRVASVL